MMVESSSPFPRTSTLAQGPASWSLSDRWRKQALSYTFNNTLDRVNVLGDDSSLGHTGCVNALSWAQDGEVLLSGGDDTTVRIWRMDPSDTSTEYPFVCQSMIYTGHSANVFNAQMLPFSSRIATVAGDSQVRVFDIGDLKGHSGSVGNETAYSTQECCIRVLRCHVARVKRITTEESPDLFLTVAEDGTVRQHDLRAPWHSCSSETCSPPLVKLPHELSTLALSPLTPYQFVVAGEAPYGYLFDRRQARRTLQERWEPVEHLVNGVGMSISLALECRQVMDTRNQILLSYSSDAVYLYSTHDEPETNPVLRTPIITPNKQPENMKNPPSVDINTSSVDIEMTDDDTERSLWITAEQLLRDDASEVVDEDAEGESTGETPDLDVHGDVPVVLPRSSFVGHCNVTTVKDVNFLGPCDEYITSGSDDGNFFIWKKSTGKLHGILEGDGSVVNVIEPHPHLPLIAISGIDTTVKLFAPAHGPSRFSRMDNVTSITDRNAQAAQRTSRGIDMDLARFILHYHRARRMLAGENGAEDEDSENPSQCTNQ